jgi:predicted ATP-dependent endonuclease of OLD family
MKLKSIWIKNFKRIKEALIDLDDHLIVIGGKNDQGKTTALDAIKTVLGGKKATPEEPIRKGAKESEIVLKSDELTAEWSKTRKGAARLKVTDADGVTQTSPHTLLSKLLSTLTFRALDYASMDAKEQGEIARRLAGLDFTEQDAKRAELYSERTDVGRDLKRERSVFDSMPTVKDPPEAEISISEAVRELARRREVNQANDAAREDLQSKQGKAGVLETTIDDMRTEHTETLAKKRADLAELIKRTESEIDQFVNDGDAEIARLDADLKTVRKDLYAFKPKVVKLVDEDMAEAQAIVDGAEEENEKFRKAAERKAAKARVDEYDVEYRRLSMEIDKIDEAKTAAIQGAKYPVEGLTVDEDGCALLDGLPFSQAGDAKKLRCSAAIGFAINPDFKMLLIDQGEMLDDENLALLGEIVKEADGQAIIARVSTGDECSVIIEDGETLGVDDAKS